MQVQVNGTEFNVLVTSYPISKLTYVMVGDHNKIHAICSAHIDYALETINVSYQDRGVVLHSDSVPFDSFDNVPQLVQQLVTNHPHYSRLTSH